MIPLAGNSCWGERLAIVARYLFNPSIMNPTLNGGSEALTHGGVSDVSAEAIDFQVTYAQRDHVLTNVNVWSPDSQRIVFDVRSEEEFDGTTIEEVEIATRRVRTIFEAIDGAHCGVATYNPVGPWVAFILGPENPSAEWHYSASRRRGVLVDTRCPGSFVFLDAMNYALPFTPGALRGGSHVHVFSADGLWVSFTYEDEVLNRLGNDGADHDLNQRNIGVAFPAGPVSVSATHARNHGGAYFSVIVTRTRNRPRPGSDEIYRACEEGWVGNDGYIRANGARQKRALAFQGLVVTADGGTHAEVFIADLPEDLTIPGDEPLEGTERRYPRPLEHRFRIHVEPRWAVDRACNGQQRLRNGCDYGALVPARGPECGFDRPAAAGLRFLTRWAEDRLPAQGGENG